MATIARFGAPLAGYWVMYWLVRLVGMTLVTYVLTFSKSHLTEISEVLTSNEIMIAGCSAALFGMISLSFRLPEPRKFAHLRPLFLGFLYGTEFTLALCTAFWLTGYYQLTGLFIPTEELLWTYGGVLVRSLALVCMILVEENLIRKNLIADLSHRIHPWIAVAICAALSCFTKVIQFDLSQMQILTLFILYCCVGLWTKSDGHPWRGIGLLIALQIWTHAVLGLPIFGIEATGLQIFRYVGSDTSLYADTRTSVLVSGGVGGPLSSLALQVILMGIVIRHLWMNKKAVGWKT